MIVGGEPASSARSRLRSRSTFSGGKKPNWIAARSPPSRSRGKRGERGAPDLRLRQDGAPAGHVLAQAPGHLEMVLGLLPRAGHLVGVGARGFLDDEGVGREEIEQRGACGAGSARCALPSLRLHRAAPLPHPPVLTGSTVISLQLLQRALGREIEPANRGDVVAPPLDPGRRRHAEAVHVEDAAPDAELGDLGDRRHPAVAHPLERLAPRRPAGGARPRRAGAGALQRRRHQGPLRGGARRRDQDPEPPAAAAPRWSRPARRRSRSAARPRPAPRAGVERDARRR